MPKKVDFSPYAVVGKGKRISSSGVKSILKSHLPLCGKCGTPEVKTEDFGAVCTCRGKNLCVRCGPKKRIYDVGWFCYCYDKQFCLDCGGEKTKKKTQKTLEYVQVLSSLVYTLSCRTF